MSQSLAVETVEKDPFELSKTGFIFYCLIIAALITMLVSIIVLETALLKEENVSIGQIIAQSEEVTYTLTGISNSEVSIVGKYKNGETINYSYPDSMRSAIELQGVSESIKFLKVAPSKGKVYFEVK